MQTDTEKDEVKQGGTLVEQLAQHYGGTQAGAAKKEGTAASSKREASRSPRRTGPEHLSAPSSGEDLIEPVGGDDDRKSDFASVAGSAMSYSSTAIAAASKSVAEAAAEGQNAKAKAAKAAAKAAAAKRG